jgi:cytochrome c-type biogenesis protein CcmH
MTALFWIIAGVLGAAVIAWMLRPLLSRRIEDGVSSDALNTSLYAEQLAELQADLRAGTVTQSDFDRSSRELKARLVDDVGGAQAPRSTTQSRLTAVVVGIAVPVCAVGIYLMVGSPELLRPPPAADPAAELKPHEIEAMVDRLAERLKTDPANVEGWMLLARSYGAFGRFRESAEAYSNALKLRPDDAQLLADYADALGMALGRRLDGEPEKLIARALEIDPRNLKALALAGTVAFERKDYKTAAGYWERMLPLVPADSDDARSIRGNVEEARSLAEGRVAKKEAFEPKDATPPKTHAAALRGEVRLAPAIAAQAAPTDTVFIFARAVQGPPVPLAVLRKQVRELPVQFALDDSMAMAPGASLSGSPQVIVGARVSKSGSPAAQPGDLQGLSAPVANDASGVTVVIDTVVR